ncbi:DUF2384 domain-containing protein [Thalassomonas sp. M1454]|uniref:DUF2384 domain-containing protein n=1 Tax=Thalassomonas sp. M1454 TaxID=2594477 RepID=UPI00117C922C|nr:DUF2384 domain-containing protein [Thalassomonas sp. M1454]TRX53459.1 DUF2384 domain-containing protein [Thalassomonas sp. M1454]
MSSLLSETLGIKENIFSNKRAYLELVEHGIPGAVVRRTVNQFPQQRQVISRALGTTTNNLSRLYNRKVLTPTHTEEMLDVLSVYEMAFKLYGDWSLVEELLTSTVIALNNQQPNELMNTFVGRTMVKEVINKMLHGEFS